MTACSATSGGLPRQRPWSCKTVQTRCSVNSPEDHLSGRRSATIAKNIMFQAQGQAAKSRRHLAPSSLPIHQVYGLLPTINSIRLLPHALWLSIIFFNIWVIVDLLYPIARVCSKSFYLRFVEMCIWNYWTASSCSLTLNIVVACLGDYGSYVPYCKSVTTPSEIIPYYHLNHSCRCGIWSRH
jgi:hypothetical protein